MSRRRRWAAAAAALTLALAGCGGGEETAGGSGAPAAGKGLSGSVTVLAASSLTEAFATIGRRFEAAHPGTTVRFSFAASSELTVQITQGAPADVFASASPETMQQVVAAGALSGRPATFARNRLQIAVPPDNPARVGGLADFADPKLKIALCAPQVPCGAAADRAFRAAGVRAEPDTLEEDVKAVLTKVRLGEVDAALVYRTDVIAADGDVRGIDFPESRQAVNEYPIAALEDSANPGVARAFVDYVRSDAGRRVLTRAGFLAP